MIDTSAQAVATMPEWLPHSFDEDGSRIASVYVPRDQHARLTFLNDQYFQNRYQPAIHQRRDVERELAGAQEAPVHFIFHTAFCASTLLVKALDLPGVSTGLKEPGVLNDLALRMTRQEGGIEPLLELTLRLLGRPFGSDRAVVVKASNVANRLIQPLFEQRAHSRAVLLYSDLATFLLAVAKPGYGRGTWARQLYQQLGKWAPPPFPLTERETELSNMQVGALIWLMQMQHFTRTVERFGTDRAMLLDSALLLSEPGGILDSVARFFGIELDSETLESVVQGPVFYSHSKMIGAGYSIEQWHSDQEAASRVHGAEVQAAVSWLRNAAAGANVPLPSHLLPTG